MWIVGLLFACGRDVAPEVVSKDLATVHRSPWILTQLVDDANADFLMFGGATDDIAWAVTASAADDVWIGGSTVSTVGGFSDEAFACHQAVGVSTCATMFPNNATVFGPNVQGKDDDAVREMRILVPGSDVLVVGTTAFNSDLGICTTLGHSDGFAGTVNGVTGAFACALQWQGSTTGKDEGLAMAIAKDGLGVATWAFAAYRVKSVHAAGAGTDAKSADVGVIAYTLTGGVDIAASMVISTDPLVGDPRKFDEPMDIAVRFDGGNYYVYVAGTTGGDVTKAAFPLTLGLDLDDWDGFVAQLKFDPNAPVLAFEKDWIFQYGSKVTNKAQDSAQGIAIDGERMVLTGRFSEDINDPNPNCQVGGAADVNFGDVYVLYMELEDTAEWTPKLDGNGKVPFTVDVRGDCGVGDAGAAVEIKDNKVAVVGSLGGGVDHGVRADTEDGFLLTYNIVGNGAGQTYVDKLAVSKQFRISGLTALPAHSDRATALTFKGSRLHIVGETQSDLTVQGTFPLLKDAFWINLSTTIL
jgi:hypothetical protein